MDNQTNATRSEEISAYSNDDGMRSAVVLAARGGFNVTLQDTDSGEYVPTVWNYPSVERAVAAAQELVA